MEPGIRDTCEWPGSFLRSEWEQPGKVLGQGRQCHLWFPVFTSLLPGTWTQTQLFLLRLLFCPGLSEVPGALGRAGVGACALSPKVECRVQRWTMGLLLFVRPWLCPWVLMPD